MGGGGGIGSKAKISWRKHDAATDMHNAQQRLVKSVFIFCIFSFTHCKKTTKKYRISQQSTQTINWKELSYTDRRELVTKMYGTVTQDRKSETTHVKNSSSPRKARVQVKRIDLSKIGKQRSPK